MCAVVPSQRVVTEETVTLGGEKVKISTSDFPAVAVFLQ